MKGTYVPFSTLGRLAWMDTASARLRRAANYHTLDCIPDQTAGGFTIVGLARDKRLCPETVVAALSPLYPTSWLRPAAASSGSWEWRVTPRARKCSGRAALASLLVLLLAIGCLAYYVDWKVFRSVWR